MSGISWEDLTITLSMVFKDALDKEKVLDFLNDCVYLDIDMTSFGKGRVELSLKVEFSKEGITELQKFRDLVDTLAD
jgi:hypothetical protein